MPRRSRERVVVVVPALAEDEHRDEPVGCSPVRALIRSEALHDEINPDQISIYDVLGTKPDEPVAPLMMRRT